MKKREKLVEKIEELFYDKEKELDVEKFLFNLEIVSKDLIELRVDGLLYDIFNRVEEYIHQFAEDFIQEFDIMLERKAEWEFLEPSIIHIYVK